MKTSEIEVGGLYLVKLPYEAGGGLAEIVASGGEPDPEDRPYPGHGKTTLRVLFLAQCEGAAKERSTMMVASRDVVRVASLEEKQQISELSGAGNGEHAPDTVPSEQAGESAAGPAEPEQPELSEGEPEQPNQSVSVPTAPVPLAEPGVPPPSNAPGEAVPGSLPPSVEEVVQGEVVEEAAPRDTEEAPQEIIDAAKGLTPEQLKEAEEAKPDSSELVIPPGLNPDETRAEVVRVMDRADELMIMDELQGRMLEVYLYSFEQDGKKLTDLSVYGVSEAVRLLNDRAGRSIRVSPTPPIIERVEEDGKEFIQAMVYAEDQVSGAGRWGTAKEPVKMRYTVRKGPNRGEKREKWDKFASTKALNKAQRNALKALIPEDLRQMMISVYLGDDKRVRRLTRGVPVDPGQKPELPPALTDEKAEAQKARARDLYAELKELNPVAMGPGAFHEYLRHAEHSHARLDDFITYLEETIEATRAQQAEAEGARRAEMQQAEQQPAEEQAQ